MKGKLERYRLRHYLAGALPARLGDEMSSQAILLLTISLTGSITQASRLLAALTFTAAIGGPLLGAVVDRAARPGRILSFALGGYAFGMAVIALLLEYKMPWLALLAALLSGFLMPAISGGWSSRLKSFVADDHILRASAIDATTFNIAGLAGPALAGVITASMGAHWAIIALIMLLMAAAPMAWLLPSRRARAVQPKKSFTHDLMVGFKVILMKPKLLRITILSVISYFGIGMLWVAYPIIGEWLLGNAGYGGVLASALSVSALIATISYAKWPTKYSPDTIALLATIVLTLGFVVLVVCHSIIIALVAMLIIGAADGPQLAAIFAIRHREAPEQSRSQIFTTGASLKITAAALGAVVAGQLAQSVALLISVAGATQLLAIIIYGLHSLQLRKVELNNRGSSL